ncbi:MAG TPA: TolC family protein, partial [Gemmatimonadaceae bacterium]|nr:TolC family protein [Gemmatimonadaceae bacterium]
MRLPGPLLSALIRRSIRCTVASAVVTGCASAPPRTVGGVASTSPAPGRTWNAPASAAAPLSATERNLATHGAPAAIAMPADVASRMQQLTLTDVVDLALGNSPATRLSWAQARAAAADYGSANGRYLPTITADVVGGPARAISANPARLPADRRTVVPSVTLQYL